MAKTYTMGSVTGTKEEIIKYLDSLHLDDIVKKLALLPDDQRPDFTSYHINRMLQYAIDRQEALNRELDLDFEDDED